MGELLIKIGDAGPDPLMRDGDTVSAFSDDQILCVNANALCHVRHCTCNNDGLRPVGSLPECYQQHTNRYRYVRVLPDTFERTDLISGETSIINSTPNDAGEHCHVAEYLARRVKHPRHWIFGTTGQDSCYGGARPGLSRDISGMWDAIEQVSSHLRADHKRYPYRAELRICLAICCDPLTEDECCDALSEDYGDADPHDHDEHGNFVECVCLRTHTVDWRELALAPEADVLDHSLFVDVRDLPQVFSEICLLKGPH